MSQKNALDEKLTRVLYILSAVAIGIGITLLLSYVDTFSLSKMSYWFDRAGNATRSVEHKLIIENRNNKRVTALSWFNPMRTSIERLRNPAKILMGAHDNNCIESFDAIESLEDSLKTTFPLIHIYTAWGSKPEHRFPELQVKAIIDMGSLPVITWEPWLTEFNDRDIRNAKSKDVRSVNGLTDIANGDYDTYIETWAKAAKAVQYPIYLRLGHEMNDSYRYPWGPQNNKPEAFVKAWRHIHDVFKKHGVTNVLWIWNPHLSYGMFDDYYPGSNYVDYIGADVLNFGTVATWSQWYTFEQIFGSHYKEICTYGKPIIISELSSLACGGNRNQWYKDALKGLPEKYPAVKAVLFFHVSDDKTTTMQSLSWYFKFDTACVHSIVKELKKW